MTFSFFFQRLIFYQYLPGAKAYLEPSQTSTMGLFLKCFFQIHKKKSVQESIFNKVAGLYPTTWLKERTPTLVFSDEFCKILKTEHLQAAASVLR